MNDNTPSMIPPERFANLLRDAGINSPEALAKALRLTGNREKKDTSASRDESAKKTD